MARVQHTCSGCIPIDASIIEVYIQLLGAKAGANAAAERAEYAAEHAIGKSPYIGENGDWWEWDDEQTAFIDTGVQAQGSIAVDDVMSATSTNPVQNKVITDALGQKQDSIADLSDIRTGAAAGATAYQKPATGIPSADLASGVQTSLGKANSAYQKPGAGIPKTDMASGVQTSLGKADTAYQKPSGGVPKSDLSSGVQDSLDLADTAVQAEPVGPIIPPPETDQFATKTSVNELKEEIDGVLLFTQDAFVYTKEIGGSSTVVGGQIDLTPQTNRPGFSYIIDDCKGGDIYNIDIYGPSATAVGYAVLDAANKVLSFAGNNNRITTEITIPENGKKIVFNNYNVNLSTPKVVKVTGAFAVRLDNLEQSVSDLEEKSFVVPQDFGAVADGVTDCRQAIVSAIASLTNGGTIFFPKGTYIINGTISLTGLKNIRFTGDNATLKKPTGDYTTMFLSSDSVNEIENVVFDHLIFDGSCPAEWWTIYEDTGNYPYPTNNNGCIIVQYNTKNCRFENNEVKNFSYGIHFGGNNASNIYICNNTFYKVYNAIDTYFVGGVISGNLIDTCVAGIQVEPYDPDVTLTRGGNIIISKNYVNNARYGISLHPASFDIVLSGNIITNLWDREDSFGIGLKGCYNVTVSDNIVRNGFMALFARDSENTIIDNLSLSNSKSVYLIGGTAQLSNVDGVITNSGTELKQTDEDVTRGLVLYQIGNPYRALVKLSDGSFNQMESDRAKISASEERTNITSVESLKVDDTYSGAELVGFALSCPALKHINTNGWDTSSITSLNSFIKGCVALESVDVYGLDVSNVASIASMCDGATSLFGFDVSSWQLSNKLTNMSGTFAGTKIRNLDFRNCDLSGVTNMSWCFNGCSDLYWIDLRGVELGNLTGKSSVFGGCTKLHSIYVKGCSAPTIALITEMVTSSGLSTDIVKDEDRN